MLPAESGPRIRAGKCQPEQGNSPDTKTLLTNAYICTFVGVGRVDIDLYFVWVGVDIDRHTLFTDYQTGIKRAGPVAHDSVPLLVVLKKSITHASSAQG
eukprot:358555-Chlamydomonas_euryale.AAC.4